MRLQYIFLFCLAIVTFVKADLLRGKCPKIFGTPFDCKRVLQNFEWDEFYRSDNTRLLLIYGFIASSRESKSLNVFAYNISQSISNFFVQFSCSTYVDSRTDTQLCINVRNKDDISNEQV